MWKAGGRGPVTRTVVSAFSRGRQAGAAVAWSSERHTWGLGPDSCGPIQRASARGGLFVLRNREPLLPNCCGSPPSSVRSGVSAAGGQELNALC